MRFFHAVLIAGMALFLAGQGILGASFFRGAQSVTATIPAGPHWFYVYEIRVLGAGRVDGRFAEAAGGAVDVFLFGEQQYRVYAFIGLGKSLFALRGSTGEFSFDLPGSGTYYLVFAHADGFEFLEQEVRVSYRVLGVEPQFLAVSSLLIGSGIVVVLLGLKAKGEAMLPGPIPALREDRGSATWATGTRPGRSGSRGRGRSGPSERSPGSYLPGRRRKG